MSSINIEVVDVTISDKVSPKGGKYQAMAVVFRNLSENGKVESKQLFDFASKDVWKVLAGAARGECYSVDREKDKREGKYWDWVSIHRQDAAQATASASSSKAAPRASSWETPEERAQRQRFIIRQSCLNVSVQAASIAGNPDPAEIIKHAKLFEGYVLSDTDAQVEAKAASVANMEDDLPF